MVFLTALFGLIVGSFLNVVIYRLGTGRGLGGRSACLSCGHVLAWFELIPLFSYLLQRGKCRECGSTLSIQYLLVEVGTSLVFLLIYLSGFFLSYTFFLFILFSLLIVIFVYDLRHTIIPDSIVFLFDGLAFLALFVEWESSSFQIPGWWEIFAGPLIALPFFLFWFLSKGRWMGLGDAKLALGMGWVLGISGGVAALVFSFWTGAIVGVFLMLLSKTNSLHGISRLLGGRRRFTMKSEIPFAPFLILGFMLALLFDLHGIPILF